jgi:predicted metal-dependent hydrolase
MLSMTNGKRILEVDGVTLDVSVTRKRVKNINARLHGTTLSVSAPHRVPVRELDETILELARKLLRRSRADALNSEGGAEALARKIADRFPDPPEVAEVLFVTNQTSQWGSYSPQTGIVRLNAALRQMPPWVLEAVVAHELAHAFHLDHSEEFWELARSVCPKTDRARAFLEGVSWLTNAWKDLPPVERWQLTGTSEAIDKGAPRPKRAPRKKPQRRGSHESPQISLPFL